MEAEQIPYISVSQTSFIRAYSQWSIADAFSVGADLAHDLTAGWWGLAELERRLIAPNAIWASERQVDIGWVPDAQDDARGPLAVRERHQWSSVLAPIYLQLLEGLRRVTEGKRGAALCRECGQPFLTLDARRSYFCTDRERLRHAQRERRKRVAARGQGSPANQ
jgi:hypothetical protein